MKKVNQDIEKIELLFTETVRLAEQGLVEASLMYCRKIVEGMLLIIQSKENILEGEFVNTNRNLLMTEKYIKSQYNIKNTEIFFDRIKTLQFLGNRAAHFTVNEPEINISVNEIIYFLNFTFNWFKEFITKFHKRKESKDLYFDMNNNSLPFCLKYIEIENYQSLKKIELNEIPVDTRFVVLTGDNGEGKTSILQAISIGIYGDYDEFSNFVLCDKPDVNITIEGKFKNQTLFNEYKGFRNSFTKIEPNRNLIAYGASRLQLQSTESQEVKNLRQSNVHGIFRTDNILQNIEYWIKMQLLKGPRKRVDAVIKLLIELMPSIEDISVSNRTDEFSIRYIENGLPLQSEQLSAGNKSILAMIGDMIIRLYNSQQETINPKALYGIVLIDELETHLHPRWQKEFPKLLNENFPLIQFIISTHSPIVFLGMPKNTVFYNISRDKNKQTFVRKLNIDIENILPNQILTSSLFGMDNIRNINNKGIEHLNVETEYEIKERLKKEKILKDLSKGFKFQLPKE